MANADMPHNDIQSADAQRAAVTLKGTKGKWETTAQHRESRAPATPGQRQSSECRREKGIREQQ